MATILLSAAGAAIGSGFGGSVLGLSGAVIGRAVGATIGRGLDQKLLGRGSDAVEVGRIERFRVSGASHGTAIKTIWGRMRVAGEVIWASRFREERQQVSGGKGAPRTTSFSYSVSLAIALCEGEAMCIGRVWADGVEIAPNSLDMRFYPGSEDQLPDPKIEAVEGPGLAPAYRGIAYVVIEDLPLSRFGNRVPQFSFEVIRNANSSHDDGPQNLSDIVRAVALIPGSGEYALATTPVHFAYRPGRNASANVHTALGATDFSCSLHQLTQELPACGSVSLVVSWFGDDLRCGQCQIMPKVEQAEFDGVEMPWSVSGLSRSAAAQVPLDGGRAVYGGTPSDRSVVEAIQAIRASGKEVMFYPFILMDQLAGNAKPDPWSDAADQPALPWRGRITLDKAPGRSGSADQTPAAASEVSNFLGAALPGDFLPSGQTVSYNGTDGWTYRRFILHYAHLCALAGGVDAFCIGSELRGLTQIRSGATEFPMVNALKQLAAEVKAILGASTRVSYAADWSEYFGFQSGGDVVFHLDPLWADENIDFVGIDNYMPISDWRDDPGHADAIWPSIYDLEYLKANIAGGEGFDWYYDSPEAEDDQRRTLIEDTAHGEDWVFRYKDIKGWWSNEHFNRIDGVRETSPTAWVPGMKPVWFTEYGCAALDKGTNQPNKFLDPKSSESSLPRASTGKRDDFIQMRYFLAMEEFWQDSANNPVSSVYGGPMVDISHSHAWAWDSRPYPDFPGNSTLWTDAPNYDKGHWLNGRTSNQQLSTVVADICERHGGGDFLDVQALKGSVRGLISDSMASGRSKLQSLCLGYGADAFEADGNLVFRNREDAPGVPLTADECVPNSAGEVVERNRRSMGEAVSRVRIGYVQSGNDFELLTAEAAFPGEERTSSSETELPLLLGAVEASAIADRILTEVRLAGDQVSITLPPSKAFLNPGDGILLEGQQYRIDLLEDAAAMRVEATRIDPVAYRPFAARGDEPVRAATSPSTPVFPVFLDLPLLRGDEVPHAPHVAIAANPWPGGVSVWSSASNAGYTLNVETRVPSIIGLTSGVLKRAPAGLWDRGSRLVVEISGGELSSGSPLDILNGNNLAAVGDGTTGNWEVLQFATATLIGANTYELSILLRGLAGTDGMMPETWPQGSTFVLLDALMPQIDLPLSARGLGRFYRIGASDLGYTDPNIVERFEAFSAIGLRPYSVAHLACEVAPAGDAILSWIRRTRVDGDSWEPAEAPLGEVSELYAIKVIKDSTVIREATSTEPGWTYTQAMQSADGITRPFHLSVAQISESFGPGPFKTVEVV